MNTRGRAITVSLLVGMLILINRIFIDELLADQPLPRILLPLIAIWVVLTIGTCWVLFYKINFKFFITGAIFPFACLVPFWSFSETFINGIRDYFGQNLAIVMTVALLVFITYLLILTVNILNGARLKDVPLAQAAKAAHFVFVLVSSYFFFTYIFGLGVDIWISFLACLIYVGYLTYSAVTIMHLPLKEETVIYLLVLTVVLLAFLLISIWPVSAIYSTVVMTIIYYMLLNLALEIRTNITNYIWLEYGLLISLIAAILLTNAVWGVNGTIV